MLILLSSFEAIFKKCIKMVRIIDRDAYDVARNQRDWRS